MRSPARRLIVFAAHMPYRWARCSSRDVIAKSGGLRRAMPECRRHTFMDLALDEAHAAADAGEVPIGCVIVCDGDLIAQAGNRTLADRDPTAHAEMLAIRQARRGARQRAASRLRPLRHARALHHVRGGDLVRAHPAALLRRGRSKGGAVESGVRYFSVADLPAPARSLWRHRRDRGGGAAARISSARGGC